MKKRNLGALTFTALLCVALLSCRGNEHERANSSRHDGREWLGWSNRDRVHFVFAYIDGYEMGVHNACETAGHLLDLKANRHYDRAKDEIISVSGVCQISAAHYSRFKPNASGDPDVSAYTGALTLFYTAHAEYQSIPYEYLMQYLTDDQKKTADDLFKMAIAGEIRTSW